MSRAKRIPYSVHSRHNFTNDTSCCRSRRRRRSCCCRCWCRCRCSRSLQLLIENSTLQTSTTSNQRITIDRFESHTCDQSTLSELRVAPDILKQSRAYEVSPFVRLFRFVSFWFVVFFFTLTIVCIYNIFWITRSSNSIRCCWCRYSFMFVRCRVRWQNDVRRILSSRISECLYFFRYNKQFNNFRISQIYPSSINQSINRECIYPHDASCRMRCATRRAKMLIFIWEKTTES